MSETAEQVKHTPRLEDGREKLMNAAKQNYVAMAESEFDLRREVVRLRAINKDLLEACKAAFRALPGSADAIAIQCQFAIAKAEGK